MMNGYAGAKEVIDYAELSMKKVKSKWLKHLQSSVLHRSLKIVHKLKGVTVRDTIFRAKDGFADKIFLERWSPEVFYRRYAMSDNLKKILTLLDGLLLVLMSNHGYFLLHLEIRVI